MSDDQQATQEEIKKTENHEEQKTSKEKPSKKKQDDAKQDDAATEEKKTEKLDLRPGYNVRVHTKIAQGDKERIQVFAGVIIAMKGGGDTRTMTVRKIGEGGIGVERIWPVNAPSIVKIEVVGKPKVRRSKLYYLRQSLQKMKDLREKS